MCKGIPADKAYHDGYEFQEQTAIYKYKYLAEFLNLSILCEVLATTLPSKPFDSVDTDGKKEEVTQRWDAWMLDAIRGMKREPAAAGFCLLIGSPLRSSRQAHQGCGCSCARGYCGGEKLLDTRRFYDLQACREAWKRSSEHRKRNGLPATLVVSLISQSSESRGRQPTIRCYCRDALCPGQYMVQFAYFAAAMQEKRWGN